MNLSRLNRILLQTLLGPVVALSIVALVLIIQIRSAQRVVDQMQTAGDNIATATQISALIVDEETGLRGYQVTGNEIFLQPYHLAETPLTDAVHKLHAGLAKQGLDTAPLDTFANQHDTWRIAFAEPIITATSVGEDTRDSGLNLREKAQMDALRTRMVRITAAQRMQLRDITSAWEHKLHQTFTVLLVLTLAVGIAMGLYARTHLRMVTNAFQQTIEAQNRSQSALIAAERLAVAGRLAATLAHEIHNPLDAVANLLYLLKTEDSPEERVQFIELATKELNRVTQISHAMLGMHRESPTPVAVDVTEMLTSIVFLFEAQLKKAQIELRLSLAPNAIVTGFPAELRQVFINLISNAADASTAGSTIEVRSTLRNTTRPAPGEVIPAGVCITVSDTGCGIIGEALPQLFQPFFTTKGEQGTGLGLWVSQGIVQKHNGTITIDSRTNPQNHGTTMTVFLPK